MANQKILLNSPIREAILDIRVILPEDFDVKTLEVYHDSINKEYPIKQISTQFEASIQVQQNQSTTLSSKGTHNGYIFKTQTPNKIVQFRKDGFTFNMLKPYESWKEFIGAARIHLENYLKITKSPLVIRSALRYINLIKIPLPIKDFKEYVLTVPEVAPNLPQGLKEFFMRLVIPENTTNNIAIITETIDIEELKKSVNVLPLIFDIDVFNNTKMEPNTSLIWQSFETIRKYKNNIFFGSLTEKAIKLFED